MSRTTQANEVVKAKEKAKLIITLHEKRKLQEHNDNNIIEEAERKIKDAEKSIEYTMKQVEHRSAEISTVNFYRKFLRGKIKQSERIIQENKEKIKRIRSKVKVPDEVVKRELQELKECKTLLTPHITQRIESCPFCYERKTKIVEDNELGECVNTLCLSCLRMNKEPKFFDYEACIKDFAKLIDKLNSYNNFYDDEELKILHIIKTFFMNPNDPKACAQFAHCCFLNTKWPCVFGYNGLCACRLPDRKYPQVSGSIKFEGKVDTEFGSNAQFKYFVKHFIPLKLRKSPCYTLMLWRDITGRKYELSLTRKYMIDMFKAYLKFCNETNSYRMTGKYKFIVFLHKKFPGIDLPLYSNYKKQEKESLESWCNQTIRK